MKKLRITALILALLMLAGTLASCKKDDDTDADTSDSEVTTDDKKDNGDDANAEEAEITVADAKGSTGLTGNFKAVFAAESGAENVVTGAAQNAVPYAIYAALSSPAKITNLVLTAPSKNQNQMANATIDASVDGVTWVTLKTLGSNITKDKTYTLAVNDDTQYLFVRVRQADEHRTEEFSFRTLVIKGIAGQGSAGDLSKITEEKDASVLSAMKTVRSSNTGVGTSTDVFLDSDNGWTSAAGTKQNYIIGTMEKKTELRAVKIKIAEGNTSIVGATVQASTDGSVWVDLYTVTDAAEQTYYINDATAYSHVKVLQAEGQTGAFALNSVLIYGIASADDTEDIPLQYLTADVVSASYDASHSNTEQIHAGDPTNIWKTDDKTTIVTYKPAEGRCVAAEFNKNTVITKITYYAPSQYANRTRTSYFEASVDGVTWVKIGTLPGSIAANTSYDIIVSDTTAYKYIRFSQNQSMKTEYWSIGTIEITGVEAN